MIAVFNHALSSLSNNFAAVSTIQSGDMKTEIVGLVVVSTSRPVFQ